MMTRVLAVRCVIGRVVAIAAIVLIVARLTVSALVPIVKIVGVQSHRRMHTIMIALSAVGRGAAA